jgi:hypothetical protein
MQTRITEIAAALNARVDNPDARIRAAMKQAARD